MKGKKFFIATEKEIQDGKASDVYFSRGHDLLGQEHMEVVVEITSSTSEEWINFTGLHEVMELLKGKDIELWTIPEGSIVSPRDSPGRNIPFIVIRGEYSKIMELETAILGFLCQSSGISTESSKVFLACYPAPFISFGIRRMHPAISPMIDRAAYIGGASGVSGILGAEAIGIDPSGTMPHSLALTMGEDRAWSYIATHFKKGTRTLLIDTFGDEKFKAIEAAEKFPDIDYIRLDTPSSRRGSMAQIIREIRWELDIRGHRNIGIMISGGLKRDQLPELRDAGANVFGIGTSVSSARVIDFGMDIVELNGKPITKRGKLSGMKNVYACRKCDFRTIGLFDSKPHCPDHGEMVPLLEKFMEKGQLLRSNEKVSKLRDRSVSTLVKKLDKIKQ